jgi:hypothetical protein
MVEDAREFDVTVLLDNTWSDFTQRGGNECFLVELFSANGNLHTYSRIYWVQQVGLPITSRFGPSVAINPKQSDHSREVFSVYA